ncbi:MAG: carboxypeptidase M32, partial [Patescibacteria group bacterium]|nr:carboxypeptidase M32 [Patescibacteria group bacterium]
PEFGQWLGELAEITPRDDSRGDVAHVVRLLRRDRDKAVKLPTSLVEELSRTAVLGQQAWEAARRDSDFAAFLPMLEKTIELKRRQADALGFLDTPYDALLDEFEPEQCTAGIVGVLEELRRNLVPLVSELAGAARQPDRSILTRRVPVQVQEAFGREAAAAIGFDFARGRLDVTAHPFCTSLGPNDTRITTRYQEDFFPAAFFGILHEAGHGIYEQGLPVEHWGLPLGEAVSLGIHESQSRLWENMVGRSRAFWECFFPRAKQHFGQALDGVSLDAFHFAINEVRPSLIRVEADEATYNLHILIRFELEKSLLDGSLLAADLPLAWNERYREYLGVSPESDAMGVLQDVHWSAGLLGYFPTYSLGNLCAAQFLEEADLQLGGLDEQFARGEMAPLREWLHENVHRHGRRYSAAQLVERVTGRPLDSKALMDYLGRKLRPLYGLD